MQFYYKDQMTGANLLLAVEESHFEHAFFSNTFRPLLTLAWNTGSDQRIFLDGSFLLFPAHSVAPLVMNQTFHFERPEELVIWQFDKPFYCIEDNDHEVSCIGFLFWGQKDFFTIAIDHTHDVQVGRMLDFFVSEFNTPDKIQGEMLRALFKRLIVLLTRIAREQQLHPAFRDLDLDIVRQFNVLVEKNFRTLHQVQDYANLLHKSPKTLTNLFALYNHKSPLEVIHERIVMEAKRLLLYTDKPVKEIAWELGFEEVPHFSRMFKKTLGLSPIAFKIQHTPLLAY